MKSVNDSKMLIAFKQMMKQQEYVKVRSKKWKLRSSLGGRTSLLLAGGIILWCSFEEGPLLIGVVIHPLAEIISKLKAPVEFQIWNKKSYPHHSKQTLQIKAERCDVISMPLFGLPYFWIGMKSGKNNYIQIY